MEVKPRELDNSSTNHAVVVDPDQLIGPQVIDMIMNKPGSCNKIIIIV